MRDPAIHLRLSHLKKILKVLGIQSPDKVALSILEKAVPYNIGNRFEVTGNAATRAKLEKLKIRSQQVAVTVARFNQMLYVERKNIGHSHFRIIKVDDKDYLMLEDVRNLAVEFAKACDFENVEEGCATYLHLGLQMMKRHTQYGLNKFKSLDSKIYQTYESTYMMNEDPNKEVTTYIYDCYVNFIAEYCGGMVMDNLRQPEVYVCFVYAAIEVMRIQADPEEWVRAQFEEMQTAFNGTPSPNQLFSDWALRRYYDYIKRDKARADTEEIIQDWDTPKNDFEARYAEKLRNKYSEQ